jgi:hypothetical protein
MSGKPQQPLEWAQDRQAIGERISRLAENPETAKDAAILWLTIQLDEALTRLARIRAAVR